MKIEIGLTCCTSLAAGADSKTLTVEFSWRLKKELLGRASMARKAALHYSFFFRGQRIKWRNGFHIFFSRCFSFIHFSFMLWFLKDLEGLCFKVPTYHMIPEDCCGQAAKKKWFLFGEDGSPKGRRELSCCKRQLEKSNVSAKRVRFWSPTCLKFDNLKSFLLVPLTTMARLRIFACFFSTEAGVMDMHPRWRVCWHFCIKCGGFDWSFFIEPDPFCQRSDSWRENGPFADA